MKQSPLLARVLRYGLYVLAIVPLVIFSQFISPFHFGKVIVFRSLIEIMAVFYVLLVWQDRSYLPKINKLFWAVMAFTAAFTLAAITSINSLQSFWGTLERMGGLWSFWHYVVFYIILVSILRTYKDWETFLKITVGVGVLSALYGFGQRTDISFFIGSGGRERIFGTIGNAALFAGYQIFNVFLSLILASKAQSKTERNWWMGGAGLMTIAVFMTAVRGSMAGIILGFLLVALLYFLKHHTKKAKKIFLTGVIGVVVLVLVGLSLRSTSLVKNSGYFSRVTDFSVNAYTVQTRLWAWKAGLTGWAEGPKTILVGWGPENFNIPFSKYFNPLFFRGPGSETFFDRAHNMFVEVLVTMGLVGFITYLGLFYTIFQTLWKIAKRPEHSMTAMLLAGMTLAYMIHNAFIFDTSANFIVFFSVLGFLSFLSEEGPVSKPTQNRPVLPALRFIVGAALLVGAVVLIYRTNIETTYANYASTRGIVAAANNDFAAALTSYRKSLSYNVAGRYEYRNQFAQALLDYSNDNKLTPDLQAAITEAITWEEKNAAENPHDYLPELYLSRLNITLGKDDPKSPYNDIALQHSQKALSYAPTFVRTYFEIGQAYLNKKDYPNAEAAFQKAVDLNPDVGLSYWYLAAVYMQAGNTDKGLELADQAVAHGYGLSENDYLNLASIYIKKNDIPHILTTYEGLVRVNPNKADYHATLAVAYARVNRIDEAVVQAHLAAQLDPNFEKDAMTFVKQLGRQW